MSDDRFKFISPGVFIEEIDKSQIPELPERQGPVIIGRFAKGPSNRPIQVKNYNDLVEVFGLPSPGNASGDIWRSGAMTAPTYAAYAAQAWLRNNTPATIVRLLGVEHPDAVTYATGEGTSKAGWRTTNVHAKAAASSSGGAYGLLVVPDPDDTAHGATTGSVTFKLAFDEANIGGGGGHISIGIPSYLSGGVGAAATGIPEAADYLKFDFVANDAQPAQGIINIVAAEAQTDAALKTAMDRFVALINATTPVQTASAGQQTALDAIENAVYGVSDSGDSDGTTTTLAAIQAALSASYDDSNNRLTFHTRQAGGKTQGISILVDNVLEAGTGADITAVLGTTTSPAVAVDDAVTAITASTTAEVTGALGAIWYVQDGMMQLMGTPRDGLAGTTAATSSCVWMKSTGGQKFHVRVADSAGSTLQGAQVNFDPTSDSFIRKSFNTDPTATNDDLVDVSAGGVLQKYWLGETFEDHIRQHLKVTPKVTAGSFVSGTQVSASSSGDFLACVVGISETDGTWDWADHLAQASSAKTGWFFSNDKRGAQTAGETNGFDPTNAAHVEKLFKLIALDNGEHLSRDIKISLTDIKAPPNNFVKFGTFSVVVRANDDTDSKPVVLERYTGVSLDPKSSSYIMRVIGDKEYAYDSVSKTVRQFGTYDNKSKYVRVEVSPYVAAGSAEGLLPYGVYGPAVPNPLLVQQQGTADEDATVQFDDGDDTGTVAGGGLWVLGAEGVTANSIPTTLDSLVNTGDSTLGGGETESVLWDAGNAPLKATIDWPSNRIRVSASEGGLVRPTQAYFGYQANRAGTRIFSDDNVDFHRGAPSGFDMHAVASGKTHYSWIFTLDDLSGSLDASGEVSTMVHKTGSRAAGDSYSVKSGSSAIVDLGFNRITSPVFGGRDGLDITEKDPFRNRYLRKGSSEKTNYAYHTVQRAIDVCSDPEFIEFDLATIPGCTHETLTDNLVIACENRGDALAIIDLSGSYEPPHEDKGTSAIPASRRTGSVDLVAAGMKSRGLNSSYGCAFFPFVQIRDTVSDAILFVPPSVVALGTMSSSQRKSAVWFAPAGFTRGGLSEGSSGLPVVGVRTRVTSDQRDKLYDANINPIASFPAEGIVVFGQKTLQVTPSALDRINVRRLLIFLKKEISQIASRTLFEQNVQATWDRFTGQINPFLESVKAGQGLTDFKVVLDKTTTTDDMIDRNILYAKIFLKPARAIEFIALDFIITRSGASFDD